MSELKEWKVYIDDGRLCLPTGLTKPNCVVIEKSAYDNLAKQYLQLRDGHEHVVHKMYEEIKDLNFKLNKANAEINRLNDKYDYQLLVRRLDAMNQFMEWLEAGFGGMFGTDGISKEEDAYRQIESKLIQWRKDLK